MPDDRITDGPPCEPPTIDDVIEGAAEAMDTDHQHRLWLRTIVQMLGTRTAEQDPCERVQKALDRLYVAAAERAARILRTDMIP